MTGFARLFAQCLVLSICATLGIAHAATLYVGAGEAFTTIQSAIDTSSDGDLIIVRDGTYIGPGNRDIEFKGKAVHLKSESGASFCVLDCEGSRTSPHRGFIFSRNEGNDSVLEGFTIKNGFASNSGGAAIYCRSSSPTILSNTITSCSAPDWSGLSYGGAGIMVEYGSPTIGGNAFVGNLAQYGGAIFVWGGSAHVFRNVLARNTANSGSGVFVRLGDATIENNTFEGNGGGACQGGALFVNEGRATVTNCILWSNIAPNCKEPAKGNVQVTVVVGSTVEIRYCSIEGGQAAVYVHESSLNWGSGNISSNPLFADPANGDFHLKSRYGRWDPKANGGAGGWVIDDVTSPCINGGDPASDFSQQPQPVRRIEIGAYGNTPEASKGKWVIPGDANGNCKVDMLDLIFVRNRLSLSVASDDNWKADVNEDGRINVLDIIYARNRLGSGRE